MQSRKRFSLILAALAALVLVLLALNVCIGSVPVALGDVLAALTGSGQGTQADIVMSLRLPRALTALFLGGALALAGYLMQTFFYNPIAGPFVLGVSSSAKLALALVMLLSLRQGWLLTSPVMIAAAFAGSMASMGFVLLLSRRVDSVSMLVVGGMMVGYICSALTDFIVTFAADSDIVNLHNWSRGSFSGMSWPDVGTIALVVSLCFLAALFLAKAIGAWQMGESYAASVGVNLKRIRLLIVLLVGILAGISAAYAGPVSFVGVATPHIVRRLLKTERPGVLIPACSLGGAVFCLFCDLLARTVLAPTELAISTVTAVFGAPVVLAVVIRRRRGQA